MATLSYLHAVRTSATTNGGTSWTQVADTNVTLAANKTYLIFGFGQLNGNGVNDNFGICQRIGSTTYNHHIIEPMGTSEYYSYFSFHEYATGGSTETADIAFRNMQSGSTVKVDQVGTLAWDISDWSKGATSSDDYNYTRATSQNSVQTTEYGQGVATTFRTSTATDVWLWLVYGRFEHTAGRTFRTRISIDDDTTSRYTEQESEDANDNYMHFQWRIGTVSADTDHTVNLRAVKTASQGDCYCYDRASVAINLTKIFSDFAYTFTEGTVELATSWTSIQSATDNGTGDDAFLFSACNYEPTDTMTSNFRQQLDNTDNPGTQTTDTYDINDPWNDTDRLPFAIWGVESSMSTSSHTLELDAIRGNSGNLGSRRFCLLLSSTLVSAGLTPSGNIAEVASLGYQPTGAGTGSTTADANLSSAIAEALQASAAGTGSATVAATWAEAVSVALQSEVPLIALANLATAVAIANQASAAGTDSADLSAFFAQAVTEALQGTAAGTGTVNLSGVLAVAAGEALQAGGAGTGSVDLAAELAELLAVARSASGAGTGSADLAASVAQIVSEALQAAAQGTDSADLTSLVAEVQSAAFGASAAGTGDVALAAALALSLGAALQASATSGGQAIAANLAQATAEALQSDGTPTGSAILSASIASAITEAYLALPGGDAATVSAELAQAVAQAIQAAASAGGQFVSANIASVLATDFQAAAAGTGSADLAADLAASIAAGFQPSAGGTGTAIAAGQLAQAIAAALQAQGVLGGQFLSAQIAAAAALGLQATGEPTGSALVSGRIAQGVSEALTAAGIGSGDAQVVGSLAAAVSSALSALAGGVGSIDVAAAIATATGQILQSSGTIGSTVILTIVEREIRFRLTTEADTRFAAPEKDVKFSPDRED